MSSIVNLKSIGLNKSPNQLSLPEGSLVEAKNIILRRDNVVESRRGFKLYGNSFGTSSDIAKQLLQYKQRILRHYSSTLEFDNGSGTFTAFSGSYVETAPGLRLKYIEANGNFYFTTSEGIKKISATSGSELSSSSGYITQAGGVKALDLTASVVTTLGDQSSFLPGDSTVGYRLLWGIKDANQNLILGSPSAEAIVTSSLLDLTTQDFNRVLGALDQVGQATGGSSSVNILDQNYVSLYNLPLNATATELYTNLTGLCAKIDNDIKYGASAGAVLTINGTQPNISSGTCQINFTSGTPSTYINPGDKIYLSGFTTGTGSINGIQTVVSAGASITFVTSATGAVTVSSPVITSGAFRNITQPAAPSDNPTHQELVDLQTQLNDIIVALQALNTSIVSTPISNAYLIPLDVTQDSQVSLTFTIPAEITSDYFYQLYRTATNTAIGTDTLDLISAGDEMGLIIEDFPTSAQISARSVTVIDNTPDSFRGANLYTNEISGQGILQANDLPPFAKDINRYKNVIFYANTRTRHRKTVSLLGVSTMLADYNSGTTPTLTISNGSTTNTYSFVAGREESTNVVCVADVSGSLNSKYFLINNANDVIQYYVWYSVAGAGTDPSLSGKTGIKILLNTNDADTVVASKTASIISTLIEDFTVSVSTNTITVTNVDFGYTTDGSAGNSGFTVTVVTQGRGENATNKEVLLSDSVSPATAVDETARSLVRVINKNSSEIINGFYLSGPSDVPGKMLLEARTLNATPFYILGNNADTGNSFNPSFDPSFNISSVSIANPTVITTTVNHGFSNGNQIIISGSNSTPSVDGVYTISNVTSNTFTIPVNVTIAGTNKGGLALTSVAEVSENEVQPNRIYYSKLSEPESVPLLNYFDVGAKDNEILRIFPLRDSLFVFKSDGLYRISGENAPFTVALFDSSALLVAADSLGLANNLIYGWTTQGISVVSEAGVSVISRPIDTDVLKLSSSDYTHFSTATWGLGYDSDNSYTVFTVGKTTDTLATIGYRYSNLTNSWTNIDKQCNAGIVLQSDDKMYLAPEDINYIEQERKSFTRYDYADREYTDTLDVGSIVGNVLKLSSITNYSIGDVLVQDETITPYLYNNLLLKLDLDTILSPHDYSSSLMSFAGDSMNQKMDTLISKIAADPGRTSVSGHTSPSSYTSLSPVGSSFGQIQTAYNALIVLLNADTGVGFGNYAQSNLITSYETIITAIDPVTKKVTVDKTLDFVQGSITIYKAIPTSFTYAPITMGDPLGFKQIREATVMFQNRAFTNASLDFATDLLPSFESTPFVMSGNGIFGNESEYGGGFFGGAGNSAPFRTTLPINKQRCRYILVKYSHNIAREQWAVFGVTLTGKVGTSSRAYR